MKKLKLKPDLGLKSLIFVAVAAVLITADLLTKYFEERYNWHAKIIPNWVEIESGIRNPGCAFSFLNEHPEVGQPILITFTFILLAALVCAFIFLPRRFVILKTSISIVIAGAVGNLVDRLMFRSVRDFFGLNMFGSMTYCNLADFFIVIGVVLAVLDLMFLNDWAVFPLTKTAKEAQAKRKIEEEMEPAAKLSENTDDSGKDSDGE